MIKRILSLLFLFFCTFCFFSTTTLAKENTTTYTVPRLRLSLSLPSHWIVFDREIDPKNPNLEKYNLNKQDLEKNYVEQDIYINGFTKEPDIEFFLTMTPDENIFNLNDLSDKDLRDYMNYFLKLDEEADESEYSYLSCEKYKTSQALFLIFDAKHYGENGQTYPFIYATTIINGQIISMTLYSYNSEITRDMEDTLRDIVDSVSFSEILEKPNPESYYWNAITIITKEFKKILPQLLKTVQASALLGAIGGIVVVAIFIPLIAVLTRKKKPIKPNGYM